MDDGRGAGGARASPTFTSGVLSTPILDLSLCHTNHMTVFIIIIMGKRQSTERLRTLDDWLNGPVTQKIRTVSDSSTCDNAEDRDQEPHPSLSNSEELCTM